MGFLDALTATAVSFTVAGNTGVSPVLTLFLVGCLARIQPELLNMENGTSIMETLLASWPGLALLGIGTVLEFVSHCVPVVDEVVDGAMTFVLPLMSILGSLSTMGLYELPGVVEEFGGGSSTSSGTDRHLSSSSSLSTAATTALRIFQGLVILLGVGLALCVHLFKMMVRLMGQGWLTGILTVVEVSWCITTIVLAVFLRPVAIAVAAAMCVAAVVTVKRHVCDNKQQQRHNDNDTHDDVHHRDTVEMGTNHHGTSGSSSSSNYVKL